MRVSASAYQQFPDRQEVVAKHVRTGPPVRPRQIVRKAADLTGWSNEDQRAVAEKLQPPDFGEKKLSFRFYTRSPRRFGVGESRSGVSRPACQAESQGHRSFKNATSDFREVPQRILEEPWCCSSLFFPGLQTSALPMPSSPLSSQAGLLCPKFCDPSLSHFVWGFWVLRRTLG